MFDFAPLGQRHHHVFNSRHYWRSINCVCKYLIVSVRYSLDFDTQQIGFNFILYLYLGLFGHNTYIVDIKTTETKCGSLCFINSDVANKKCLSSLQQYKNLCHSVTKSCFRKPYNA